MPSAMRLNSVFFRCRACRARGRIATKRREPAAIMCPFCSSTRVESGRQDRVVLVVKKR